MTDDELIARVLELARNADGAINLGEYRMFCDELAVSAPNLARRLKKANERIAEFEKRDGYGWDRKLSEAEAHKCKCGNPAYLFCRKEYEGDELIFSYFVACPNCMAHYPKMPDSYIGSTGETVALEEWNESFED